MLTFCVIHLIFLEHDVLLERFHGVYCLIVTLFYQVHLAKRASAYDFNDLKVIDGDLGS
jgi:hypothetical protein